VRPRLFALALAACCALATAHAPAEEPKDKAGEKGAKEKGKPNRLAKSSSPYLLQHAHNPVDWYPWGPEAFARAKKENKLVFLSVGYSACHWCHVMERESFSNAEVARLLNAHFVCIKVDREERPDIDDIYMTAMNVSGEQGGWPLNMFLTPDGKPIFGGTYFPPDDKKVGEDTIPGFKTVLSRLVEADKKERAEIEKHAEKVAKATAEALEANSRGGALVPLKRQLISEAVEAFDIDPEHGGTSSKARLYKGTKFPRPPVWGFLLAQSAKPGNEALKKKVRLTLSKMAEGGIYDQLGGGFHRYSTERTWTVPHFEKMLYDNAQLVELYSEAFALDPRPEYERAVAETLAFVKREMTSPGGGFYSALDADSNGKEGEFYVWTDDELKQVLGAADLAFLKSVYDLGQTNFEGKYHILRLPKSLAEIAKDKKLTEAELLAKLAPIKKKLFDYRAKRERPFLDTKVIAAWNGEMIAGYAKAAQVFKKKEYADAAARAADLILIRMRDKDGRLLRLYAAPPGGEPRAQGAAFLDDYAYVIHGLLNLHDATGEKEWLDAAKELTDLAVKWYADASGGFYFTASDGEKLFARSKDSYDGVQPSGNAQMARNLLRLGAKLNDPAYRERGARTVKAFSLAMRTSPTSTPAMLRAADELLASGEPDKPAPKEKPGGKKPKESADVVTAKLALDPAKDGKRAFTLTLTVEAPWHLYANPVGFETLAESQTEVSVFAGGKPVEVKVDYPKGKEITDSTGAKYRVYEGTVKVTGNFPAAGGEVEVRVKLSACKEGLCLPPSVLKVR
jgi:uncharacterized protein YyaL (SSP411 family)